MADLTARAEFLVAGVAELEIAYAELQKRANYDRRKWQDYEEHYILPCFVIAEKLGIDLRKLVQSHPGNNCVILLIREILNHGKRKLGESDLGFDFTKWETLDHGGSSILASDPRGSDDTQGSST